MADITDAMAAIVALAAQFYYPAGTALPSLTGDAIKIRQGWPIPAQLEKAIADKIVTLTVFATNNVQNVDRYRPEWQQLSVQQPTITATVGGGTAASPAQTVTIGGAISTPQNVGVLVNRKPYIYPVAANDTPTSIATALAAMIAVDLGQTVSAGAVITIPQAVGTVIARVGSVGTAMRELSRERHEVQLTWWCASPAQRALIVPPFNVLIAKTHFLTLADQSACRFRFHRTWTDDNNQKVGAWRRDIWVTVEFPITETMTAATSITTQLNLAAGPFKDGVLPDGSVAPALSSPPTVTVTT